MRAQKLSRSKLVALLPFQPGCPTRLAVEVSAIGCINKKLIGIVALRGNVSIVALITDLRNQCALRASQIPMLSIKLISTLMEICGRRLWGECIQPHVVQLLRIDCQGKRRCLFRIYGQVGLCIRGKALQFCVPFQWWKAFYWRAHETVLKRLHEGDTVLDDWTGEGHSWGGSPDAGYAAVAISQARKHFLN